MADMPELIWATPYGVEVDSGTYCDAAERPTSPNHMAFCYRRTDTIPGPRVKALIEAAKNLREQVARARSPDATVRLKDFRTAMDRIDTAIAAFEGGKTDD